MAKCWQFSDYVGLDMCKLFVIFSLLISSCSVASSLVFINLTVVDSQSEQPVSGARVQFAFQKSRGATLSEEVTDLEGKSSASGVGGYGVNIHAEKKGYYYSRRTITKRGSLTVDLKLRKVVNPVPMYAKKAKIILPQSGVLYGFDFTKGDLVAPHGEGLTPHVRLMVAGEKQDVFNYDKTLTLSFSKNDGIVQYDSGVSVKESKFKFPYLAPENGYHNILEKHERRWQKEVGYSYDHGLEGDYHRFQLGYAFRVNSEVDKDGDLISANYGKIYGEFAAYLHGTNTPSLSDGQAMVVFTYSYNPVANERSLEFDVKKNLFGRLPSEISVSEP
ncbi:trace amine-associated receptor [Gilvimarinus sp. DA14]|uniref:trace amine-associated receptor n=1 Tax=Gilvimarinus sp. DA14 TaxID=2956798 RepID=UPI0020B73A19|nr:trace amine-associated receptor [Gilvimarinus sp. DA14]UTF60641.1 trace amine-associated receptor [Gilvimarinus sp. DA14]